MPSTGTSGFSGSSTSSGAPSGASGSASNRAGGGKSRLARLTWLSLCAAFLIPLVLSGCSLTSSSAGPQLAPPAQQDFVWPYSNGGELHIAYNAVLDPAAISLLVDAQNADMLYASLVSIDDTTLQPKPYAATYDVDATGTVYTFHLKPNLHFSDGTPLTASDYAYSINRAMAPNLCTSLDVNTYGGAANDCAALGGGYLSAILGADKYEAGQISTLISAHGDDPTKGLSVLDPLTLRIRLAHPAAYFLEALADPIADPVERTLVENPAYAGGKWVDHLDTGGASGPFKVGTYEHSATGDTLVLVPNPYWEQGFNQHLTLQRVERPFLSDVDTEYANYKAGKYSYTDVPADVYGQARGQGDFHEIPTLETDYFGLNFNLPPFNNSSVRLAFDLALNKQLLVDRIENGGALPTNHIVPAGMPGYDPGLVNPPPDNTQSLTGNQAAAQELITAVRHTCATSTNAFQLPPECAYVEKDPTTGLLQPIKLYYINGATTQALVQAAAIQWNNVLGVNVQTTGISLDTFLAGTGLSTGSANSYQIWEIGWAADYPDPQDWLSLQFMSGNALDIEGVRNSDLDKQMSHADANQNEAQRMAEYNKIEQAMINLCAWIPFQQTKAAWRVRLNVHGFIYDELEQIVGPDWAHIYITTQ